MGHELNQISLRRLNLSLFDSKNRN